MFAPINPKCTFSTKNTCLPYSLVVSNCEHMACVFVYKSGKSDVKASYRYSLFTIGLLSNQKVNQMKKIFTIIDRVKKHFGSKSEGEVASLLGISKTALANHKSRDTIPYEAIFTFCENSGVSLDWLFTGEGNPKREKGDVAIWDKGYVLIPTVHNLTESNHKSLLKALPNEIIAFKKDWILKELSSSPEDFKAFQIFDDTMDPTFKNGDLVIIDSKNNGEKKGALTDGIYMIRLDDHLMVRRLQTFPEGLIQVISDNQVYKSFYIKSELFPEKAQIIGQVVWAGKKIV